MADRGRPLKFKSVKELGTKCDAYFLDCDEKKIPYTITGLALFLDSSRETLCEYAEGKGRQAIFVDTIKKAKCKVEYAYELRGMDKNTSFDIFRLKNMGWKDKQDVDVTTGGEKMTYHPELDVIARQAEEKMRKQLNED